ncbi:MAG: hypothetical protein IJA17_09845 [Oscillospiraceae bacterium]|nr:hypothetical protein [Oscillospiraceae bacterium]
MTETQKRIEAYQKVLPDIKEKVAAVAMLLALSVIMLTSASFAWLTISRAPEVTSVATNVAANGNLEIALVSSDEDGNAIVPDESNIGDSFETNGQDVTAANLTWGNLVNLKDPSYGLDNFVLRPAKLETANLDEKPLYSVGYGQDGRIDGYLENFGYTSWVKPEGLSGYFEVSNKLGVRAISSTEVSAPEGAAGIYYAMVQTAKGKNTEAANNYVALKNKDGYMDSLAAMMGYYMTAKFAVGEGALPHLVNPTVDIAHVIKLEAMYADFLLCYEKEAEAMADLANAYRYLVGTQNEYTTEMMLSLDTKAMLQQDGVPIQGWEQFVKDYNTIYSDHEKLLEISKSGTNLQWKETGLNDIVNHLVNVGQCTIAGQKVDTMGVSSAMKLMFGTQEARITNGILVRYEQRTGGYLEVKGLKVSATAYREEVGEQSATITVNIKTTADRNYNEFTNDVAAVEEENDGKFQGAAVGKAQDTYALAVDLWVRTNSYNSILTLAGNLLTETREEEAVGKDGEGNPVDVYVVTGKDTEGNETTFDVYYGTKTVENEDGTTSQEEALFFEGTNTEFIMEEGETIRRKMNVITTVLGYEGENRVWGENESLPTGSTTQGSGSCYVFYADNPEDQVQSLQILDNLRVAFIDEYGSLLATAEMGTENIFEENGRVTVPLVLKSSDVSYTDINNNTIYGITTLEQNRATRITAIVYLDGGTLTNDMVLASAGIQGQLNIQFGSSTLLEPISNEKLEQQYRIVTARIEGQSNFEYGNGDATVKVVAEIEGDGAAPETVTGFFIRKIGSTQGSKEETMIFSDANKDGKWEATYTFTAPGNYILRSIELDGQEYELEDKPEATVEGFALQSLTYVGEDDFNDIEVMTADRYYSAKMSLKFVTEDVSKMPGSVQGRFNYDGGTLNVDFAYDSSTQLWEGTAVFRSSAEYTMKYLVLDGEHTELAESFWKTADIKVGMKAIVYTTSPHEFLYEGTSMPLNQQFLGMKVKVVDDAGNEIENLPNAKLIYAQRGNIRETMDTDLEWNAPYYEGELATDGPGIWQFMSVQIAGNDITVATESPVFEIMSPNPPEYYGQNTIPVQWAPGNNATMNITLTDAGTRVKAVITSTGGTSETVVGSIAESSTFEDGTAWTRFNFVIPNESNGRQDGTWKLERLEVSGAFSEDGVQYTEEAPLIFDENDFETEIKAQVVTRITVNFSQGGGLNELGGTSSGGNVNATSAFMTTHNVPGIEVKISDQNNVAIIKDVVLTVTHNGSMREYGGYTNTNTSLGQIKETYNLTGTDGTFAPSPSPQLTYAGKYSTDIAFTAVIGGVEYELNNGSAGVNVTGIPSYQIYSITPSVQITEAKSGSTSSSTAAATGYSTTVYFVESKNTTCGITTTNYTSPYVKIAIAGYGSASDATLTFVESNNGTVRLYTTGGSGNSNSGATSSFIWTAEGICMRYVGDYGYRSGGSDSKTAAGTLKATKLVLTYGGHSFEVDIPDITISNPE